MNDESPATHSLHQQFQKKWLLLGTSLAVAATISSIFCIWFFAFRSTGPIPKQYTQGLKFDLYYPTRLPNGFSVDQKSFKHEGDVLIFSINTPYGKNVAVSEQALPSEAAARKSNPAIAKVAGEKDFTTSIGQAHISLWGDKYVSDIVTSQSWIIMNVSGLTTEQAITVTQSFTKVK